MKKVIVFILLIAPTAILFADGKVIERKVKCSVYEAGHPVFENKEQVIRIKEFSGGHLIEKEPRQLLFQTKEYSGELDITPWSGLEIVDLRIRLKSIDGNSSLSCGTHFDQAGKVYLDIHPRKGVFVLAAQCQLVQ